MYTLISKPWSFRVLLLSLFVSVASCAADSAFPVADTGSDTKTKTNPDQSTKVDLSNSDAGEKDMKKRTQK